MKTTKPRRRPSLETETPEQFARAAFRDFRRKPLAERRALLIKWDILNPNGTLRRYPMDHVPYGPRE